jgi:hypothetical protein
VPAASRGLFVSGRPNPARYGALEHRRIFLYNRLYIAEFAEVTMRHGTAMAFACGVVTLVSLHGSPLGAQSFVGTWVRQDTPMTMTVEMCCGSGRRLTYRVAMNGTEMIMVVESLLDGADAPLLVGGKPTGETMAIRQIDGRHATAVLKMNGKPFGTAKGTLSAHGKTLTIEDDYILATAGQQAGKQTETWIRR